MSDSARDRRKLIAVVYADMVGYSRLIGLDDVGTLERLRALRRSLIDPAIDEHGGRLVNTGGDSLLLVFDSAEGAVRCAIKVQQQVPIYDGDQPADRAIRFRVGIHVGDAIADGTDVHGDVVNVAARLQAECLPGGVCVSRSVRDHIRDRLDLRFGELGPLDLKNIARPIEAFIVKVGVAGTTPPLSGGHKVPVILDKPSIAVLAFTNMSGDLEQEYFSDGVAEDIIAELSRSRSLFVIARNSSFTYKGQAMDVKQVARDLGVRYVLEGSVRRHSDRIRVTAQLIDAETGSHIWAERYDREIGDIFAIQDEITLAVTTTIGPLIADAERQRAMRKPPNSLGAWEAYQRGLWHLAKGNATANAAANGEVSACFQRAADLDPLFAAPRAMRGFVQVTIMWQGTLQTTRPNLEAAEMEARSAIGLDPDEASALAVLAWVHTCNARFRQALELAEHAISANPSYVGAYMAKGRALAFSGEHREAEKALQTALRLSPRDPLRAFVLGSLSPCHYFAGEYEESAKVAELAIRDYPDYALPYRWLAAALGQLGRPEAAGEALRRALAASPASFDFFVRNRPLWFRVADHEHMLEGLYKAGWRE